MSAFDPPAPPDPAKKPRWKHPVVLAAASIAGLVGVLAAIGAIRHKPPAPAAAAVAVPAVSTVTVGGAGAVAAPGKKSKPAHPPRFAGADPAYPLDAPMRPGARLEIANDGRAAQYYGAPALDDRTLWVPAGVREIASAAALDFSKLGGGAQTQRVRAELSGFFRVPIDGIYTLSANADNAHASFECALSAIGGLPLGSLTYNAAFAGRSVPLREGFHAVSIVCRGDTREGQIVRLSLLPDGGDTPTPMQLFLPVPAPAPTKADVLAGEPEPPTK